MNWLDSHCHINDAAFKDDLEQVLDRMVLADVRKAMIISSYLEDYDTALKISDERIAFKHTLGIYPGDVDNADEELFARYAKLYEDDRCDAIGEIGLDYHWDRHNIEKQKQIFKRQLELARRLDKPVIIHSRDAIEDTYELLKAIRVRGVMHCYSDSADMAAKFVELGMYVSVAGPITWKKADEAIKVAQRVPLNRLLIETDCPYLAPAPMRGKRNEPSFVVHTGRKVAEVLGIPEEEFKKQLNENYQELFGL